MVKDENKLLTNGIEIPTMAFGTWQIESKDAYEATKNAILCGYRHIDTAMAYENEKEIGQAIKDLDVRKDIFLASKLPSHIKTYEETKEYFQKSLENLQTDYLDLYLIHAPWPWSSVGEDCTKGNIEAWKAMIDLYKEGKIRSIGVSNFHPEHIEALIQATSFVPHVNQIRFFIGNTQEAIYSYCKKHHILVEAYSPLATGKLMEHPKIIEMAKKYNVSIPALCIRYCIERDTVVLVKSIHKERMLQNLSVDFEISKEDMKSLLHIEIPNEWKRKYRS